jgi:poly(3-hydroxybutyrate) depolymerase
MGIVTNERDQAWVNALKPYLGGRIVPLYMDSDGTVNAEKTIDRFCELHGVHKLDPKTGQEL